jgi:hypothetical protein
VNHLEFGDVILLRGDHGTVDIRRAPPLTRISLQSIADGHVTLDHYGLCLGGQVWYTPVDLTPDGLTLVCRKTRDLRPLVGQAKEDRARV